MVATGAKSNGDGEPNRERPGEGVLGGDMGLDGSRRRPDPLATIACDGREAAVLGKVSMGMTTTSGLTEVERLLARWNISTMVGCVGACARLSGTSTAGSLALRLRSTLALMESAKGTRP
jgi:hypothetical protein